MRTPFVRFALLDPTEEVIMNPSNDPLYHLHCRQATRRGVGPLPYAGFCERLKGQTDTDLTQLLPAVGLLPIRVWPTNGRSLVLGEICLTESAIYTLPASEVIAALEKHACCDWSDLPLADRAKNERAYAKRGPVSSVHYTGDGIKFYILTWGGWQRTTVMLPEDR